VKKQMEKLKDEGRRAICWCDPKSFKVDTLCDDRYVQGQFVTEGTLNLRIGDIVTVTRSSGRFWKGTIGDKSGTFFSKCVRWLPEDKKVRKEVVVGSSVGDEPTLSPPAPPRRISNVDDQSIYDHIVQRSVGGNHENSWLHVFNEEGKEEEDTAESNQEEEKKEASPKTTTTTKSKTTMRNLAEMLKDFRPGSSGSSSSGSFLTHHVQQHDEMKNVVDERSYVSLQTSEQEPSSSSPDQTSMTTSTTEAQQSSSPVVENALRKFAEMEFIKRGEALERQRRKIALTEAIEKKLTYDLHEQALRDAAEQATELATRRYESELSSLRAENLRLSISSLSMDDVKEEEEEDNEFEKSVLHQQAVHEMFDKKLADLHDIHEAEVEDARRLRDEQIERARVHYESSVDLVKQNESMIIQDHEREIANELDELNKDITNRERVIESLVHRAMDDVKLASELDDEVTAVTRDKEERHREIEELDCLRRMQTETHHENQIRKLKDDHMEMSNEAHENHAKSFRSLSEDLTANVHALRNDYVSDHKIHRHYDEKISNLHTTHDAKIQDARRYRDEQIERARAHYESSVDRVKQDESMIIRNHERAIASELDKLNDDIAKRERVIESLVHRAFDDVKFASELDDEATAVMRDKVERHREIEELDRLRHIQTESDYENHIRKLKDDHARMRNEAHENHTKSFRSLSEGLASTLNVLRKQKLDSFSSGLLIVDDDDDGGSVIDDDGGIDDTENDDSENTKKETNTLLRDDEPEEETEVVVAENNPMSSKQDTIEQSILNEERNDIKNEDLTEVLRDLTDLLPDLQDKDDFEDNNDLDYRRPPSLRDNESEDMTSTMIMSKDENSNDISEDTEEDILNMSLKVLMESDFAPISSESSGISKYTNIMMDVVSSREQEYDNILNNDEEEEVEDDDDNEIDLPPTPPLEISSSLNDADVVKTTETSVLLDQNEGEIVYRNDEDMDSSRSNSYSTDLRVTSYEGVEEDEEEERVLISKLSPIVEQDEDVYRDMRDGHDMRDVISGGGYYGDRDVNETTTFQLYERSRRIHIGGDGITINISQKTKEEEEKKDLPSQVTNSLLEKIERDKREPQGWWVKF
jgi:hypothetical protein